LVALGPTLLKLDIDRGRRRDENGRDYIRWCFANPAVASAFASEFDA
jgi:hypothetical protein